MTELTGNFPNPFKLNTIISFSLQQTEHVQLNIYNIKGQKVITLINEELLQGSYSISWNGKDSFERPVSGGIYFCKMTAGKYNCVKKMILLK